MDSYFGNKSIIVLFKKWIRQLLVIAIASIILGSIISFFIPPLYKSSAILYPVNLPSLSAETKTEQMMQIIQSVDIQKKIFAAFDLGRHYKLKQDDPYYFSNLMKEFNEKVFFKKTEYDAIAISIFDKDPKMAYDIVDSLIKFYNAKVESIHKQKNLEMVQIKGEELFAKKQSIDSLEVLLKSFRLNYGIFDVGAQGKELTRGLVTGGKDANTKIKIDTLLRNINERSGELNELNNAIWLANVQYNSIKEEYEKHLTEVRKKITYCVIVESPYIADKKSSPVRIVIVLLTLIITMVFASILILILENRKVKIQQ